MLKFREIGRLFSTALYCFSCVYYFIFTLFNSTEWLREILWDTKLRQYVSIDDTGSFVFFVFAYMGALASILLTILYKNELSFKRGLFLWLLVAIILIIAFTMGFSHLAIVKAFYWLLALIAVFIAAFSVWMYVKGRVK